MKKRIFILLFGLSLSAGAAQALTLSGIETQIRRNVRDTSSDTSLQRYSDAYIDALINEGQRDVINNTWAISKSSSISLVSGTTYYLLPTTLIQISRVTADSANLPEIDLTQLDFESNNTDWANSGTPKYFFLDRSTVTAIGVYPYPSASGTLKVTYFSHATDLSSDTDEPFNALDNLAGYHDLLVYYVSARIEVIEGRADLAKYYEDIYLSRLQVMNTNVGVVKGSSKSTSSSKGGPAQ